MLHELFEVCNIGTMSCCYGVSVELSDNGTETYDSPHWLSSSSLHKCLWSCRLRRNKHYINVACYIRDAGKWIAVNVFWSVVLCRKLQDNATWKSNAVHIKSLKSVCGCASMIGPIVAGYSISETNCIFTGDSQEIAAMTDTQQCNSSTLLPLTPLSSFLSSSFPHATFRISLSPSNRPSAHPRPGQRPTDIACRGTTITRPGPAGALSPSSLVSRWTNINLVPRSFRSTAVWSATTWSHLRAVEQLLLNVVMDRSQRSVRPLNCLM